MENKNTKPEVPDSVKFSEFGCTNCLYNGVECPAGNEYIPKTYTDSAGQKRPSCENYVYYD